MENKKYRVRLVRPVFQTADIEVEAGSEDEAVLEAIYQVDGVPEASWAGRFDPESYFLDVHWVQELSATEDDDLRGALEEDRKYLLLRGDIESGTGSVPFQPWLADVSDLMVADLCSDWSEDLGTLERLGVASYFASLDRQVKARHNGPAKVLPFRRPGGRADDDDATD